MPHTPSPAMDAPVVVKMGFRKVWNRQAETDEDELFYVAIWPTGETRESLTIPRAWDHLVNGFIGRAGLADLIAAVRAKGEAADAAIAECAKPVAGEADARAA